MKYFYFVSYRYMGGFGNTEMYSGDEIKHLSQIEDIEKCLKDEICKRDVVVTNYILLRKEE